MSHSVKPKGRSRESILTTGLGTVGAQSKHPFFKMLAHPMADYYMVCIATGCLVVLGILMVASASSVWSSAVNGDSYYYLVRQLIFLALGLPAAWILSRLAPKLIAFLGWVGLCGSILLLILIFSPLGVDNFGNRAWLSLSAIGIGVQIQPSEFAKVCLIVWSASVFANRTRTLAEPRRMLFPFLIGFGLVELLVVLEHDMGTAMVIGLIMLAMLWHIGAPVRLLMVICLSGLAVVAISIFTSDRRKERILSFFNPDAASGASDQPLNAIYALASGGWWGLGLGHSRQKWGGLYNGAQTDYVLAVLGEEMGLVGTLIVLVLFFSLAFAGCRIASRSSDRFLRYASAGITSWIVLQALINIFVVMRFLPVVGVPLPFLSQGGSALLANLLGIGVLLAAARNEPDAQDYLAAGKMKVRPRMTTIVDAPRREGD